MSGRIHGAAALALIVLCPGPWALLRAQQTSEAKQLTLSGTFTSGYYQTEEFNGLNNSQGSGVASLRLDLSGYLHDPNFLRFSAKPQGSLGTQSSEAVFPDGRGVSLGVTAFGGTFPLTLSYTRLNRQLVTFGALDRLAGLEAETSQESLSVGWRFRLRRLPELSLNYSTTRSSYEPLAPLASQTESEGKLFSAHLQHALKGWRLNGEFRDEHSDESLLNVFNPLQPPYLYGRDTRALQGMATRDVESWLKVTVVAGKTDSASQINGRPFDQSFSFGNANLNFRPSERWNASLRAGITSNLVGVRLEEAMGPGGPSPGPDPLLLVNSQARVRLLTLSGSVQYAITKSLRADVEVTRDTTRVPDKDGFVTPESSLTSLQAGLAYTRSFRRVQVQAEYLTNVGRFAYERQGASRSNGHRMHGSVSGMWGSIEVAGNARFGWQDIRTDALLGEDLDVRDRNWGFGGSAARSAVAGWKLRASYQREHDTFDFASSRFQATSNSFSLAAVHRRGELAFSQQMRSGLSFQPDLRLRFLPPAEVLALQSGVPVTVAVPSTATYRTFAASLRPLGQLSARVAWTQGAQTMFERSQNRYHQWEASASYHFRQLTFDAGYISHAQNLEVANYGRNRFFVRVVREFQLF